MNTKLWSEIEGKM